MKIKDTSNNKFYLPPIKKTPLLLCNDSQKNLNKKMFRNNTFNHIYSMNSLKNNLDLSRKYNDREKRKPINRQLFKQWVRDIDEDYQRKFCRKNFLLDNYEFQLYPDKKPILKIEKINIEVKLNNLQDLIDLANKYPLKYNVEYNINMKAIHDIKKPVTKLNNMIGMSNLKSSVLDQIIYFIQNLHIANDKFNGDFMHTVIAGPPGTGKTEIAKIMGEIFCNLGVLKKKVFKKATRSDLIAGYLGQTALKTKEMIKQCLGGVLFIDEAYALGNQEKRDSFAKECIDTLCEALSDHKTDLMVIIAGYENDLNKCFFSYNKGLDSRFTWRFKTDDYSAKELNLIFHKKIKDIGWKNNKLKDNWFENKMEYFSYYGRDMETLLSKVKIAHSRRVFCLPDDEKKIITLEDLNNGYDMFMNNDEVKNRNNTSIINHMYC